MRTAPVRLTKYESGIILEFLNTRIKELSETSDDEESSNLTMMMLEELRKKMQTVYNKTSYVNAYTRKENNENEK